MVINLEDSWTYSEFAWEPLWGDFESLIHLFERGVLVWFQLGQLGFRENLYLGFGEAFKRVLVFIKLLYVVLWSICLIRL